MLGKQAGIQCRLPAEHQFNDEACPTECLEIICIAKGEEHERVQTISNEPVDWGVIVVYVVAHADDRS